MKNHLFSKGKALFFFALLFAFVGCYAQKANLLYVISAQSGELVKQHNAWYLKLHKVSSKMLFFTDRPQRQAGHTQTQQFLLTWKKVFDSNPNGSLVYSELDMNNQKSATGYPLQLINPTPIAGGWSFKVIALPHTALKEYHFTKPFLFIDMGGLSISSSYLPLDER